MLNAKRKGAEFERKVAEWFRANGFPNALRTAQRSGKEIADVDVIPWLHIECKHQESLNLQRALDQASRDADEHQIPVVIHRTNRTRSKITFYLDDLHDLATHIVEQRDFTDPPSSPRESESEAAQ